MWVKNWGDQFTPIAAWPDALYAPVRANGKTAEDLRKIVHELDKIRLGEKPKKNRPVLQDWSTEIALAHSEAPEE